MDSLGIVVSYCSNEKPFLAPILQACAQLTDNIVISYADKMYDGSLEDVQHLQYYGYKYPFIKFVEYQVDLSLHPSEMKGVVSRPLAYYHNLSRYTAVQHLDRSAEWVLVIDADEIPRSSLFLDWLVKNMSSLNRNVAYKLATYWYFKEPTFRAKTYEDSILLIHRSHLTEENIFHDNERDDLIRYSGTTLQRMLLSDSGEPMFDHFSWVRGKDGLRKKMNSWAHKNELFPGNTTDEIIEYIYHNDQPNDVVHRYEYDVVPNAYDISF